MWREEHLWNVNVLQRGDYTFLILKIHFTHVYGKIQLAYFQAVIHAKNYVL
jgi:hypothetical protein